MDRSTSPLRGIKVIELASVLAGPSVGQFFAELGAEVIKIENRKTGGDVTRGWLINGENPADGISAYFSSVNWGKKSLAADLLTDEGKSIARQLIAQSDFVISSFKAGDDQKLGVDYQTAKELNPKIIYGHITGYGATNPRTGYDAIIQAEAGFMHMNGEPDGPPVKMPVALIDILAAHHLKEGLMVALLNRNATGRGDYVHVSLFDAALASLANQATNWLVAGKIPGKMGQEHPNIVPYGKVFITADGKEVMLAVGTDAQFKGLCEILGIDDVAIEPEFAKNENRVKNRKELYGLLSDAILKQESVQFLSQLREKSIPSGIINAMDKVFQLPESLPMLLRSNNLRNELIGVRNSAFSLRNGGQSIELSPPPTYGQHTEEILIQQLSFSSDRIHDLRQKQVI